MTRLSTHFNISLNPNPKPPPLHLSHLSMIVILFVGLTVSLAPTLSIAYGTNEGSYQHGFWKGTLTGPQFGKDANWNPYSESDNNICVLGGSYMLEYPKEVYGIVIPAVTNTTACQIGFFSGWKNWCSNHAVDCVQNITRGDFPPIILQLHEQYLRGYNAANGSGNSMCPIGNNAAFCQGWDENNGDYGESDCGDAYVNYTGPFSNGLIGCPLDTLKASQMAALPMLVGNWDFVNETNRPGISGTMKFGANGVNMTVPNKTAFGDYGNFMGVYWT